MYRFVKVTRMNELLTRQIASFALMATLDELFNCHTDESTGVIFVEWTFSLPSVPSGRVLYSSQTVLLLVYTAKDEYHTQPQRLNYSLFVSSGRFMHSALTRGQVSDSSRNKFRVSYSSMPSRRAPYSSYSRPYRLYY
jgi:hypothetical protein